MLSRAGISKQDQEAHPNEVLKVIDFYQATADSHEDIWEKFKNAQVDKHKEPKKSKKHLKGLSHEEHSSDISAQTSMSAINSSTGLNIQGSNSNIDISRQQTVLNKESKVNDPTSTDYEPTFKKDIDLKLDFGSEFNLSETIDQMMNFDDLDLSLNLDTPLFSGDDKEDVSKNLDIESVEDHNNKKISTSHLNMVYNFDNLETSNEKIDVYETEKKTQSTILPTSDNVNRVSTKPGISGNTTIHSDAYSPASVESDKSKPDLAVSQTKPNEYPQMRQRKVDEESQDIIRQLKEICHETNPESLFTNLEKIGQGYVLFIEKNK